MHSPPSVHVFVYPLIIVRQRYRGNEYTKVGPCLFTDFLLRMSLLSSLYDQTFLSLPCHASNKQKNARNSCLWHIFVYLRGIQPPIHTHTHTHTRTPWPESASELYRPSDHRFSATLVPTFLRIEGATWSA
jgi:hypothetical protein